MCSDPQDQEWRDSKFTSDVETPLKETETSKRHTETVESSTGAAADGATDEPNSTSTEGDDKPSSLGEAPKPLAAIAKEHGGDAGNIQTESESSSAKSKDTNTSEAKEEDHESKGTGEQYVKTTGLAADGGDFDATKPGAGREADRKTYPHQTLLSASY